MPEEDCRTQQDTRGNGPGKDDQAEFGIELTDSAPHELSPGLRLTPVGFGQAVGGKEDEELDAKMAEEGEEGLQGERGMNNGIEKNPQPGSGEGELILMDGADGMEEVVKYDGGDRQPLKDGGIAVVDVAENKRTATAGSAGRCQRGRAMAVAFQFHCRSRYGLHSEVRPKSRREERENCPDKRFPTFADFRSA